MELQYEALGNVGPSVEDWEEGKPYYRLTITTDYNLMKTYIARKDVPAGIELGDENYWKLILQPDRDIVQELRDFEQEMRACCQEYGERLAAVEEHITKIYQKFEEMYNIIVNPSGDIHIDVEVPLSQQFGDDPNIGISQKTLTYYMKHIMSLIGQMNGTGKEIMTLDVDPDYFISDGPREVKVKVDANGSIFDELHIYFDEQEVFADESVVGANFTVTIDKTTVVKAVGKIMGVEHVLEKTIRKIYPFFIGAGETYEDVVNEDNIVPYNGDLDGEYTIDVTTEGQRFFIVVATKYLTDIRRIDMNGYDIPFNTSRQGEYTIFTSVNRYLVGTYLIHIN